MGAFHHSIYYAWKQSSCAWSESQALAYTSYNLGLLACRIELHSSVVATQPLLAATLALLVVFNFSALVVCFTHMRASGGGLCMTAEDAGTASCSTRPAVIYP